MPDGILGDNSVSDFYSYETPIAAPEGNGNTTKTPCLMSAEHDLIIVFETNGNPGMSVENNTDNACAAAIQAAGLSPHRTVFVVGSATHYGAEEAIDYAYWSASLGFQHVPRQTLEHALGYRLPVRRGEQIQV